VRAGFGRDLLVPVALGVIALALLAACALIVARALAVDDRLHGRYHDALAVAQYGIEAQPLLDELRGGGADAVAAAAALRKRLAALGGFELTGAERQQLAEVERLLEGGAPDARAVERAQRALVALVGSVRDRTEAQVEPAHGFRQFALALLIAATALTIVVAAALGGYALRTLAAHRERLGQLDQMAHEDALTGLVNRRRLDEMLPIELARAQRLGYPLTVAMLDLDFFKRFNDKRGHGAGDALLRDAAQAWQRQLRPTDVLARYGGEEFTLVLPACDAQQAAQMIERLRPLTPERQTFSAGVATWDGRESADELLQRADLALLTAKRGGRNRTTIAGTEPQTSLPLRVA
jgi:diguanylate cyclase (GGDEF)-like protein